MSVSAPSPLSNPRRRNGGFTLVELLVVITIIIILAFVTVSVVQGVRRSAAKVSDLNNVRNLTAAAVAAGSDNGGKLPQLHMGAKDGNSNAAPNMLAGRIDLESYGIYKEACYAPSRKLLGGAPDYKWWFKDSSGETSTEIHYVYFANDATAKEKGWFTNGKVTPPSEEEYRGSVPRAEIISDPLKAFARTISDDVWYPVLWAGLCRNGKSGPEAAIMKDDTEPLGVNVSYLDGRAEWVDWAKMKNPRYKSGGVTLYW